MTSNCSDDRRVVITGIGAITPLGHSTRELWDGLCDGRSGIAPITQFDASLFPSRIAGEIKEFDPGKYINPKLARRIARCSQLALAMHQEALADARLKLPFEDEERVGVLIGTALGGLEKSALVYDTLHEQGWDRLNPFVAMATLSSMPACLVSQEIIVCVLTIARGIIHPTINYETPDPECDLDYVPDAARQQPVDVALSNSFGLGGQNACLVFRRIR